MKKIPLNRRDSSAGITIFRNFSWGYRAKVWKKLSIIVALTMSIVAMQHICQAAEITKKFPLKINNADIAIHVANTAESRATGLMGVKQLSPNSGVLFVFPKEKIVSMWMKNTLIELAAIFIDEEGVIVNIETMKPLSTRSHKSKSPVKYVLEVNPEWMISNQIMPGQRVWGLEEIPDAKN
jgi:uncharacterized membrane protein (UPF0127 family)